MATASLGTREVDILRRCLLAEFHTSPSTSMNPRLRTDEIKALEARGLLEWRNGWRCTEAGKAELNIAGIDTRGYQGAAAWSPAMASTPTPGGDR